MSLTKGGISPTALSPMRMALREEEMKMAHVISALCFVSRMRLRDQELTNGIHLGLQMSSILRRFFGSASLYGMVGVQYFPRAHQFGLIVACTDPHQRGRYEILPWRS